MTHRIVSGDASINAWDQTHADALTQLRGADAFVLVTWPTLGSEARMIAMAKDGGEEIMRAMLGATMKGAVAAYAELDEPEAEAA